MATRSEALSGTPVDLTAALSLVDGQTYNMQVQGGNLRCADAATAPDLTSSTLPPFRRYRDGAEFPYVQGSDKLWGWGSGRIVCDEAS